MGWDFCEKFSEKGVVTVMLSTSSFTSSGASGSSGTGWDGCWRPFLGSKS